MTRNNDACSAHETHDYPSNRESCKPQARVTWFTFRRRAERILDAAGSAPMESRSARAMADLIQCVRDNLSADLLYPEQLARIRLTPTAGHAYVASEALWHLTARRLHVFHVKHENASHWYLAEPRTGIIWDATADQYLTVPPYRDGRRAAFLTRHPSRRALILIQRCNSSK